MNPQTRILDIETMALGIIEACKSLKQINQTQKHHPKHPCEENGCTDWHDCDEICIYHPDFQKAALAIHDTKILNEIDSRCKIAAEEYCPNPDKCEWASDSHRDPFNEVREWIKEIRQKAKRGEM